jgi:hypothetical protein
VTDDDLFDVGVVLLYCYAATGIQCTDRVCKQARRMHGVSLLAWIYTSTASGFGS